jgi:NAD(P)-dependent dehydrogenase (short-subunit alcohol dehydrogenase family)
MARIFVTGSADGLGRMTGRLLVERGHRVVLHARSARRADDVFTAVEGLEGVVVGDVSTIAGIAEVAADANATGRFDAVVHNVAVGYREPARVETEDGLSQVWAVNVLAPYLLTALMERPDRLVYLSSGMHLGGDPSLLDVQWAKRRWRGAGAYSDSKLHDVLLALAVARRWPGVASNAVNPGWVPTRMGGAGAPDDLEEGNLTQAWLAEGGDADARRSGRYLYHRRPGDLHPMARDEVLQDTLLDLCQKASGVVVPER